MRNYNVSRDNGVYGSYLNYAYNGAPPPRDGSYNSEMSEYDTKYHYQYPYHAPRSIPKKQSNGKNGHNRKDSVHHNPSVVDPGIDEDEEYDRGEWGSKAEFILSCVGYSVGLGNVWRFPYLAYSNGGAAFLLPYIILLIFVGKPLYYLETAMGQFSKAGPVKIWNCAPIAQGVGVAMVIVSFVVAIYYNVIMAYSLIYVGASIQGIFDGNNSVPWSTCNFPGATENCTTEGFSNETFGVDQCRPHLGITENCTYSQRPSLQYWENFVLDITDQLGDFGDIGGFGWYLPTALLFSWTVVFLCLMKGVKSSGKVVYFTATFPYVILIALLVKGLLLEGAVKGLKFLFLPDFNKLLEIQVWKSAAEQMFFSLGISWGGLMMFGSYNKFYNKVHYDAAIVTVLDFITSLISSIVVFSILGNLSVQLNIEDIEDVTDQSVGLAFVAFPEALAQIKYSWIWALLFFLMLFLLGLDSEFAFLETVLTAVYDFSPKLRNHKIKTTFVACASCFLLGLPCASRSGSYILDIMNRAVGFGVVWIAIWEIIGFAWIYGYKNIGRDFKLMLKSAPNWFWNLCWVVLSPIALIVIFIWSIINWEKPKYNDIIPYPDWAHWVYWAIILVPAAQIPIWAVLTTVYYAFKRKIHKVLRPTVKWGPGDKDVRRAIIDQQNGIVRNRNPPQYAYDNQMMNSNGYPYA